MLEQFAGTIGYNGIISLYWTQYSINIIVYATRREQFANAYQDVFKIVYLRVQTICCAKTNKETNSVIDAKNSESYQNQSMKTTPNANGKPLPKRSYTIACVRRKKKKETIPVVKIEMSKFASEEKLPPVNNETMITSDNSANALLGTKTSLAKSDTTKSNNKYDAIEICEKQGHTSKSLENCHQIAPKTELLNPNQPMLPSKSWERIGHLPAPETEQRDFNKEKPHSRSLEICQPIPEIINPNRPKSPNPVPKKEDAKYGIRTRLLVITDFIIVALLISFFAVMFTRQKFNSKLLILGGYTSKDYQDVCSGWLNSVEVIDLENFQALVQFSSHLDHKTNTSFENLPKKLTDASGALFDNVPLVCGGISDDWETSKSCYKMISIDKWEPAATMSIERSSFASTITKHGYLVVGGFDIGGNLIDSVEILPTPHSNFTSKKKFKKTISSACMVAVDDNTVLLIGGYLYPFDLTNHMWKYDIQNDTWEPMPEMVLPRAQHSCATVRDPNDGTVKIIVAGGKIEKHQGCRTVEIFHMNTQMWTKGPDLPFSTSLHQLIQDGTGEGALLVGGRIVGKAERSTSILHLSSDLKAWKHLGRNMKIGRASHIAMLIPESLI